MGIDNIDLSVTDFTVSMNRGIDTEWSAHFADQPFSIATGGESISLNFDARNGTQIKAHGTMHLNFGEFFSVEGNLSVESFTDTINVSDGTEDILSNILTIGASDINAFVGSSDQTTGINLSNLDFALAIIKPTDTEDDRTFTSLAARADSAGFRGIDDLTLEGNDIFVAMNLSSDDTAFADFSQKPLNIDVGGSNEVTFNFDGSLGQIKRLEGAFDISIHDFFQVNGQLGFEHYSRNFTLADESTVETNLFTVGASGLDVFAGIGPKDSDNALGFAVDQADFGLALITPKDSSDNRSWTALKADAGQAGLIGSDDIEINAQNIGVNLNLVQNDNENVVDFASDPLEITVGPDSYAELDFNGEKGNMMSIETYSTINLFDFFQTEGNVAFEQMRQDIDIMQTDGTIETGAFQKRG
jgi:hypothetical protein